MRKAGGCDYLKFSQGRERELERAGGGEVKITKFYPSSIFIVKLHLLRNRGKPLSVQSLEVNLCVHAYLCFA